MRHSEAYPRLAELLGPCDASPEMVALREHASGCRRCSARLAEIRRIDTSLGAAGPLASPPPGLTERVLAIPDEHLQASPPRRRYAAFAGVAAAAAAAAFLVAVIVQRGGTPKFVPAERMELVSTRAPVAGTIEMTHDSAGERIRLTVRGLSGVGAKSYRLWLIGATGEISLPPFRPTSDGDCVVMLDAPPGEWTKVVLTTDVGSPGGSGALAWGAL